MALQIILLIVGIICLVGALALVLYPRWAASVPAYVGLLLLHWSYFIAVPTRSFVFWGIATAMATAIYFLSPSGEPDGNRSSNVYVGFGAMAGGLLGILVGPRIMVLGVVLGALMGQLAYSRTPMGKWMMFPSTMFWRYFAAKCLPAIVAVAIVCIAIEGLIIE